jgi:hypothetical protein
MPRATLLGIIGRFFSKFTVTQTAQQEKKMESPYGVHTAKHKYLIALNRYNFSWWWSKIKEPRENRVLKKKKKLKLSSVKFNLSRWSPFQHHEEEHHCH